MEDNGYDNMAGMLWEETTEDFKQRLQAVLDEILNFGAAKVYYPDKHIDPDVDLEEEF